MSTENLQIFAGCGFAAVVAGRSHGHTTGHTTTCDLWRSLQTVTHSHTTLKGCDRVTVRRGSETLLQKNFADAGAGVENSPWKTWPRSL